jgi:hypothetical protein
VARPGHANVGTVIAGQRPEHPHFDGPPWQDAIRAADGWSEPHEIRLTTSPPARPDRIVASISWIAALPVDERADTLARIDAFISASSTPAELPVHVQIGLTAVT